MAIKIHLVVQTHTSPEAADRIERTILAAKLTQQAAQKLVDATPGTYIQRIVADKT